MKGTARRKKAAAQKADLKTRLAALTSAPSGNAKGRAADLDPKGMNGGKRSDRRSKGKNAPALTGRARSLLNLHSGRTGARPKGPTLTKPADADTFVSLRASGVPPLEAVAYFAKGDERLSAEQWQKLSVQWETSALTKTAWDKFHGGEWQSMDDEQRQDVALRLHLSQCAYLLYTNDVNNPLAPMGKVAYAKNTILAKIAIDKQTGTDDKFTEFLKTLTANANAGAPAVWKEPKGAHADRNSRIMEEPADETDEDRETDDDSPDSGIAGSDFDADGALGNRKPTRH